MTEVRKFLSSVLGGGVEPGALYNSFEHRECHGECGFLYLQALQSVMDFSKF